LTSRQILRSFRLSIRNEKIVFYAFIICLTILSLFILYKLLRLLFKKQLLIKEAKKEFFKVCKDKGFSSDEAEFLYEISSYLEEAVLDVLNSLRIFEEVVDRFASNFKTYILMCKFEDKFRLIRSIRRKLGFNIIPRGRPLSSTRQISAGQTMTIMYSLKLSTIIPQHTVLRENQEAFFKVDAPRIDIFRTLSHGMKLRIKFFRASDAEYQFETEFLGYENEGKEMILKHTLDLNRTQKRQYFRVEVDIPVIYSIVSQFGSIKAKNLKGWFRDISGGGVMLISNEDLSINDLIEFDFEPENKPLVRSLKAYVIRKSQTIYGPAFHLKFHNISEQERQIIIKYVFKKFQKLMEKHEEEK